MTAALFRIWRGEKEHGEFRDYRTDVSEGMVVLDAVHQIQAESAGDLAAAFARPTRRGWTVPSKCSRMMSFRCSGPFGGPTSIAKEPRT